VATGQRREGRGASADVVKPYRIVSREFLVGAWGGVTAEDVRDGVSLHVGPTRTKDAFSNYDKDPKSAVKVTRGPIDYPDSYKSPARFIRDIPTYVRDPAAPADQSLMEVYCLVCSFRPWMDFSEAETVWVTFARRGHTERVKATKAGDRWVSRDLRTGEAAYVCPGDAQDAWGNYNREISPVVGDRGAPIECAPLEERVNGPVVDAAAAARGGADARSGASRASLGLPSARTRRGARRCFSRRRFTIHLRSPRRGLAIRSAKVYVNGKRVKVRHGKRFTARVNLRGLRKGRFTVRIRLRASDGRTYVAKRRYHTCTPKKKAKRSAKAKAKRRKRKA
jgi:hypothetical protein